MSKTRDKRVETIAKMISEDLGDDTAYVVWKRKLEELILEYQNPHVYGLQSTWEFGHHDEDIIKDALWKLIKYMFSSHPNYVDSTVWRRGWKPPQEE
jgi:flavodoxin